MIPDCCGAGYGRAKLVSQGYGMNEAASGAQKNGTYVLAIGFGTSLAMWAIGYLLLLPGVDTAKWLVFVVMALCMVAGGYVAGRFRGGVWRSGLYPGVLTAAINLLVIGSLLGGDSPNEISVTALVWIFGSLILGAALGSLGSVLGSANMSLRAGRVNWTSVFAHVAAVGTFLLLVIGGIVTSQEAGLAVPDWPNSYGYTMFLFPLSEMTGGVYYEHAHRLFGSLVGLTVLVLAVHIWRTEKRAWVKGFAGLALTGVIIQGLLGGLRVTGHLTTSSSPDVVAPNLSLAVVHGILGQIFLGIMVALATFTMWRWQDPKARTENLSGGTDRRLTEVLLVTLVAQIGTGALLRHTGTGLHLHITLAVFVLVAAIWSGSRAWGAYKDTPIIQRLGITLIHLVGIQIVLGLIAFSATRGRPASGDPSEFEVIATTAHQAGGALVVACAVSLALWVHRLVRVPASRE
jgi:cytochrome c oxidase assembly protein subunit 15